MEKNDPSYAVCVRTADLDNPVADSTTDVCADCGEAVWVSPASREFIEGEDATIQCVHCGIAQMKREAEEGKEVEIVTTAAQQREVWKGLFDRRRN